MSHGITWGKVIAGASIAVGAVVLLSACFPGATPQGTWESIQNGFKDFFAGVGSLFQPAKDAAQTPPQPGITFSPELQKGLLGAAAVGGGLALGAYMDRKHEDNEHQRNLEVAHSAPAAGGFQEKEQIRAMQGLMKARMAAVNPEYAAGAARG